MRAYVAFALCLLVSVGLIGGQFWFAMHELAPINPLLAFGFIVGSAVEVILLWSTVGLRVLDWSSRSSRSRSQPRIARPR